MKKITLILTAIFSIAVVNNNYSQVFWTDSFDITAPTSGTRSAPNHANTTDGSNTGPCGSGDYFFRTNLSDDVGNGITETFSGYSGYYWRGEDLDGCFGNPDIINFTGIDISGKSNLIFKGLFGANGVGNRFESNDNIFIEYSIDGGSFVKGLAFESDLNNSGISGNLREDTNLNGFGDGTLLTTTLAEFDFAIPGNGTTLSLRITVNSNSSGEEFAFDTFTVEGSAANTAPAITGTVSGQVVNDNSTISPFSSITTTDTDGDNLTATITLDNNAKGVITGASSGSGPYTITSRSASAMQTALRALIFNPTDNRSATSETTTFTVVINDGADSDTNNTTTVISNAVAPTLSSSSPSDNDSNIVISSNIILTFNENISKGTSGNITIKKTSDDSTVETIAVTSGMVTTSSTQATINPSSDLDLNTEYYVLVDNTAFKDAGNKDYIGISSTTALSFTTEVNQTNTYLSAGGSWSDPTRWSLNRIPISTDNVVTSNSPDLDISSVIINNLNISGSLNIETGNSLTVNGNLTQTGILTINSDATTTGSLIVKGTATGNVTYKRNLTNTNWHLIGAPVSGQSINAFSASLLTNGSNQKSVAIYDNTTVSASRWSYYTTSSITSAGNFIDAKGYSVKRDGAGTLDFTGTLNTTDLSFPITDGGDSPNGNRWNLIANPYIAALNGSNAADATNNFLKVNIDAGNLDPSRAGLYLWNGSAYEEKSVDDAAFYIAPSQGFFVHAPDAGGTSASFTEAMQTHQTGNIFLKSSTSYPEIILKITDGTNNSLTKLRYIKNKTTGLDVGSDIGTFTGTSTNLKVFTHLVNDSQGIDFAIQALPNNNFENMVVPVGVFAESGKEITFSLEASNFSKGLKVYLEDKLTNTFKQLDEVNSTYNITLSNTENGIGRFYIHTRSSALSIDSNLLFENVSIYKTDNTTLRIAGLQSENASIKLFNILGKQVFNKSFSSKGVSEITLPKLVKGVYIIQLQSETGKLNKKIILE
ncbi:Ig-like domain-containing protein [uncultured Polaribacter sp.]|uniref:Ig-like domain-containing protein n=1 Tax=uncultured Polaribacter sp. TaxID=174711 RepID=UPI0026303D5A|nr:Ig-like domain-containing protein [uncultured Polaribacter sp.]